MQGPGVGRRSVPGQVTGGQCPEGPTGDVDTLSGPGLGWETEGRPRMAPPSGRESRSPEPVLKLRFKFERELLGELDVKMREPLSPIFTFTLCFKLSFES